MNDQGRSPLARHDKIIQLNKEGTADSALFLLDIFAIAFPVLQETAVSSAPTPHHITGYEGPQRRILVVDDRPENRLVLLNFLEPVGFAVALAENGQEAVEQVPHFKPDLIFMDLVMPVMMGFEAVAAIHDMPDYKTLPIIAVSASVLETDRTASRRVGCDDFITKPIEAGKLFAMLQTHLNLTWLYDGASRDLEVETAVSPQAAIIPPPQTELETLVELARLGNMKRLQEHAQQLETTPQYQSFAHIIPQLADDFEDEKLLAFVMRFWQTNSNP